MRKRPSPHRGASAAALRLSKSEIAAAKALSAFRPRKSQAGSFVHVGLNGKPLPPKSARKGIMVYVWATRVPKKGKGSRTPPQIKFKPVRERGKGGRPNRSPIRPRRSGSIDLFSTGHKKAAAAHYKRRRTHTAREHKLRPTPTEKRQGISYTRFSRKLGRDLRSFVDSFRSRGSFLLDISVTVKLPSGQLETHNTSVLFSQREIQHLRPADYEKFVQVKVYQFIAQQLSAHGLVTAGSAAHIRSLSANKGVDRSDWVNRRGEPWEKQDFQTVKIVGMSYQLSRVGK